ncbi:hypothetical protein GLOIN_2v1777952 [Rhizophagus irregularis DAOM 181602=DAOM 197198]|uniref:Uncharacterized protein n=1 Tax=Rhizophagus irregularis (strain DAOM 181602 / DAOM 197198 / MUCL 43194) TaxID=747089 RepID=A0A2P4PTP0_RHIID|nr:hypothetical protein GLOIN_2v1777952 [Rhizophagus irregularis DAOM 181602=DAOM 197198]POG68744.1 hypothetical protein GLOIN_2v1777952 [Rhizophagus irregularis DAOM 181602=DAOM 197198]|eukprot:XP_025175610.1 hypothetical protein GLOIN_2v1777952 [Rhizophagus irregularis DAOM 181602=DAOM 197198]
MNKSPKRSFLIIYSLEEKEIADVNSLQKEFEEIANKASTDSENIVDFDNKVVFGLKVEDAFEEVEGENDLLNVESTDSESTEVEGESILSSVESTDSESTEFDDNITFRLEIERGNQELSINQISHELNHMLLNNYVQYIYF